VRLSVLAAALLLAGVQPIMGAATGSIGPLWAAKLAAPAIVAATSNNEESLTARHCDLVSGTILQLKQGTDPHPQSEARMGTERRTASAVRLFICVEG